MPLIDLAAPVAALVVVFLFAIGKFSKQVKELAGERFRELLSRLTASSLRGTVLGAVFTSLIQSSTATTVLTVGLVNAGLLTFTQAAGVIVGANIGTTITSQLVALNIMQFAPYLVILGFFVGFLKKIHYRYGKLLFYFGLVFLSLSLVSSYVQLGDGETLQNLFTRVANVPTAIALGFLFTALVQSSTVTTGLTLVFVSGGFLTFSQAVGIILGGNIGTTMTALVASLTMNRDAKRTALFHLTFNVAGVLLFAPFIPAYAHFIGSLGGSVAQQVANAHVFFNLIVAVPFLLLIRPIERMISAAVKR